MIMRKAIRAFGLMAALILVLVDSLSRVKDVYKWVDEEGMRKIDLSKTLSGKI